MPRNSYNDILAFITVATEQSFTKAASLLGVSQSALSHSMRGLEERMGIRLLTRTTRSVAPTEAGLQLLQRMAPHFAEIDQELENITALRDKPAGTVRISCGDHVAETLLWPKLRPIIENYPDIKLELNVDYGLTNIVAERFDAGVRFGEQLEKDMIAVPIGPQVRMAVVGTKDYFSRYPKPQHPQDLLKHQCVNLRLPTRGGLYAWEFDNGERQLDIQVEGQVIFNTVHLLTQAALDGVGLAFLPEDVFLPYLADDKLERVLEDWCVPFPGYHLYYPNRRNHTPAFQLVVEHLRYRS